MPSVKKVFHQLDDSYMEKISSPSYIDNVCIKCHHKLYVYEYDRILSACNGTQYPYCIAFSCLAAVNICILYNKHVYKCTYVQ